MQKRKIELLKQSQSKNKVAFMKETSTKSMIQQLDQINLINQKEKNVSNKRNTLQVPYSEQNLEQNLSQTGGRPYSSGSMNTSFTQEENHYIQQHPRLQEISSSQVRKGAIRFGQGGQLSQKVFVKKMGPSSSSTKSIQNIQSKSTASNQSKALLSQVSTSDVKQPFSSSLIEQLPEDYYIEQQKRMQEQIVKETIKEEEIKVKKVIQIKENKNLKKREEIFRKSEEIQQEEKLDLSNLQKKLKEISKQLKVMEYETQEVLNILQQINKQFNDIDEHSRFQTKSIVIQILSNKTHKLLYDESLIFMKQLLASTSDDSKIGIEQIIQIFNDLIEGFVNNIMMIMQEQKKAKPALRKVTEELKKKLLFRSSKKVSFYTFLIISLSQNLLLNYQYDTALLRVAEVVNGIVDIIISKIKLFYKEQIEWQYFISIFISDLLEIAEEQSIELPICLLYFKAFTLQVIQHLHISFNYQNDDEEIKSQKIDLSTKQIFVEILSKIIVAVQQIMKKHSTQIVGECYCGEKVGSKDSEYIQCEKCGKKCHLKCVNSVAFSNEKDWNCLQCSSSIDKSQKSNQKIVLDYLEVHNQIRQFYHQYQSTYYDFSSSLCYIILRQTLIVQQAANKLISNSNSQLMQLKDEFNYVLEQSHSQGQDRNWITRGHLIHPNYAKAMLMFINAEIEFKMLFLAIKKMMLCVSFCSQASIRTLGVKAINKIIKINPSNLLDNSIEKIIQARIQDPSAVTRESTLDLVSTYLYKEDSYTERYLPLIIERANDSSIVVRKKVIQLLSSYLKKECREDILKVLIKKWNDSNIVVRQSLVDSMQKLFTQKVEKEGGPQRIYQLLKAIIFGIDEQYQSQLSEVLKQAFAQEVGAKKGKNSLIQKYGASIFEQTLQDLIQQDYDSIVFLRIAQLLKIIGMLTPLLIFKQLKSLLNLLSSVSEPKSQSEICQIFKTSFEWSLANRHEVEDYITPRLQQELISLNERIFLKSSLLALFPALELYTNIAHYRREYSQILSLFSKCKEYLQQVEKEVIQNKQKKELSQDKQLSISRSILICSYLLYIINLNQVKNSIKINLKDEVYQILSTFVCNKQTHPQIFDISLEGLSYIWLEYPDLLLKDTNCNKIFSAILNKFTTVKNIKEETKARIIETFIKFLSLYDEKMQKQVQTDLAPILNNIEKQFCKFIQFLESKDHNLRLQVALLINKMFEQGLLAMNEAPQLFIKLLGDCNQQSQYIGIHNLMNLSQKKLYIVKSSLVAREILEQAFIYQSLIYSKPYNQVNANQKIMNSNMEILENNEGIFDQFLTQLEKFDKECVINFITSFISLSYQQTYLLEQFRKDSQFLIFYGQLLFQLVKLTKRQNLFLKESQGYLSKNEQQVYDELKQKVKSSNLDKDMYGKALILFILKNVQKICTSIIMMNRRRKGGCDDEEVEGEGLLLVDSERKESEEIQQKGSSVSQKTLENQDKIIQLIEQSETILNEVKIPTMVSKSYLQKSGKYLKQQLKLLVKEKESQYRVKLEKELFGTKKEGKRNGNKKKISGQSEKQGNVTTVNRRSNRQMNKRKFDEIEGGVNEQKNKKKLIQGKVQKNVEKDEREQVQNVVRGKQRQNECEEENGIESEENNSQEEFSFYDSSEDEQVSDNE